MQPEEQVASSQNGSRQSIAKSTAIMSIATTFSRGTGYLRVFALAYALGGTVIADTYNAANYMPNIIFELVMGGILGSVLIPVFVEYLTRGKKEETDYMISNALNIILVFGIALSLIGSFFSEYFIMAITLFKPARATPLMVLFFRIFAIQMMFYALAAVFYSILNSHRKFFMPMMAPVFNNLTVVLTVFLIFVPLNKTNPDLALIVLAIGTTLGVVVMPLVQAPAVFKTGFKYRPVFNLRHPAIKQIVTLGLPMLGWAMAIQVNNMLIYSLALQIETGVTAYQYSMMFFQLPYAIFAVSVITAIFPELSEKFSQKDMTGFKRMVSLGLRSTSFIVIPASVTLLVLSKPVVSLALQYGKFDPKAVAFTAPVLSFFALGLLSFSLYNMLTRVYYSLQDTKTPMKISIISVPLQIALNFVFIGILGVRGLALSYALTLTFAVVIQLYLLRRKIGPLGISHIFKAFGKQFAAAIPAGFVMYYTYRVVDSLGMPHVVTQFAGVFGPFSAGVAIYIGLALLFGVDEVDFIKTLMQKVFRARVKTT